MRVVQFFVAVFVLALMPSSARADWYQASSRHFLIYSEQKPKDLRQFAEELEKFDGAVRFVRRMDDLPPSPGNRVTIFVFNHADPVQKLAGDTSGLLGGFYRGRVAGSVAYVSLDFAGSMDAEAPTGSHVLVSSDIAMHTDTVLLHEYAHHLMFQDSAWPYPEWLVEGFAEFMSTARFEADGSVGLGLPAKHRYAGLLLGDQLPLEKLLSGKYDKITGQELESIYGRGWLLTHYFTFEPSRRGQLDRFVADLAKGLEPLVAARQEFGDLDKLNHDLNSYLQRSKLQYVKISPAALKLGPIEVTKLSAPASAALPFVAALKNDPDAKEAGIISNTLGALEGRANGDTFVEVALAEANLDAAKFDAAEAAADRALAASPGSTEAMILKGRARIERAAKAKASEAEFNEARNWLLKANKIDPEDPEPLYEFYNSFVKEGVAPNQNAIDALHYASDLAPQDESVRLMSAGQYVADGRLKEARSALVAVAYDPHGQKLAATARDMIGKIDAGDATGALKAAGWTVDSDPHR